jgi:hypothetical protein
MAQIIKQCERVTETRHRHDFEWVDGGGGYGFPCEADGTLYPLDPCSQHSWDYCLANPDKLIDKGIRSQTNTYTEPAILQCDCGEEFALCGPWESQLHCDCGRHYNALSGSPERDLRGMSNQEIWADELVVNCEFLD